MRKSVLFSTMFFCLFLLTSCEISGTVKDTNTGEGIEGVKVSIMSSGAANAQGSDQVYTSYTDPDGNYHMSSFLEKPKDGKPLTIRFSKEGYAFEPDSVTLTLNDQGQGEANSEGMPVQ